MIRHVFHLLFRLLAVGIAGLAVLAGVGLWLLSRGPISLDPLAPYVSSMLSQQSDFAATIDHTFLSFENRNHIAILARGVHFRRAGRTTLTLDELALEFGFRPLLSGIVAPTRIALRQPDLRLVRDTDGRFRLGIGAAGTEAAEDWGATLINDLVHPSGGNGALAYLRQLSIERARLSIEDRSLGVTYQADSGDFSLERSEQSSRGRFAIGAGASRFSGDYIYTQADDTLTVRLGFADLHPARWANAAPALTGLAALDAPASGQVIAAIDGSRLTLRDATWDVSLGPGTLRHSLFVGGALSVSGARLQAGYDPAAQRLNIGLLSLQLAHGAIGVAGTVDRLSVGALLGDAPQAVDLQLTLAANALKIDDFAAIWPETAAAEPRKWVIEHLHDGTIEQLQAQLAAHLDGAASPRMEIRQFEGHFGFTGLTVDYFRPLPAARHVTGIARFDPRQIEFTATSGDAVGVAVSAATAGFYGLDGREQQAKVRVTASGGLGDALAILDTPPLFYARAMGLDPKQIQGRVVAQLDLAFPLAGDLRLAQITYDATAELHATAIKNVLLARDLSDGELRLKLNRTAAEVSGTAKLAGIPINLVWSEPLERKGGGRARYDVRATLDEAQRRLLGLDVLDTYAHGPVGVQASYSAGPGKTGEVTATLDLADCALDVAALGWSKAPGVKATALLTLDLDQDAVTRLRDATLIAPGIDAAAAASFAGGRTRIAINRLITGETNLRGEATLERNGAWSATVAGRSFDATVLMKSLERPGGASQPPFVLKAELDRLILGRDREASRVVASLASNGPHWQSVSLTAKLGEKAGVALSFGGAGNERRFNLTSDDFGALLRLADVYDHIQGGTLTVTGEAQDRDGARLLALDVDGRDYRVADAPGLARLLSLGSLSGIAAMLHGDGIPFSTLRGRVIFAGDLISLKEMRAYGGALGINASGNIDRAKGIEDIAGTLVPAYTLNSVLGDIPVLGNLLVGGAGQGLFAANFRLSGPLDDPRASLNPLSTLAPGVLRKLFLFSPGGAGSDLSASPD